MELALIINKLKRQKGLSSERIVHLSGVPIGTLNKILNGETKNPKLETMFALARALECSVDDFDDDSATTQKNSPIRLRTGL
jgi:transcriptional regulator with XRE-family HTH domain